MTARLPSSESPSAAPAEDVAATSHAITPPSAPRVVSLSPAAAGIELKPLSLTAPAETPSAPESESLHETAREEQWQLIERLGDMRAQLLELEPRAGATAASLHERLRLGARMLQAFAAQITRIESALAGLASKRAELENQLRGIHASREDWNRQADQATAHAAERIESAAREAVSRVQAAVNDPAIGSLADRLGALESRLRALEERAGAADLADVSVNRISSTPATDESDIRNQINELAHAMRELADRFSGVAAVDGSTSASLIATSPQTPDHAPLRFQKWATHG